MDIIPKYQHDVLDKGMAGNFSLVFTRMTSWREHNGQIKAEFQSGTRKTRNGQVPIFDPSITQLGQRGNELLPQAMLVLQEIHRRQGMVLEWYRNQGTFVFEVRAQLTSPYVSGLGSGHPTETGMILDRNSGMPFIPSSTIKGMLRLGHSINLLRSDQVQQWLHTGVVDAKGRFKANANGNQLELDDREPSLRKYFGDTDTKAKDYVRGQLVFLDAFPETPPTLKVDIMNPHFQNYYGGSQPPLDCDDPNPIKFLAVQEGTVFVFRVLVSPLTRPADKETGQVQSEFGPDDERHVRAMFFTVFEELGFGGKTSVGYGRFLPVDESETSTIQNEVIKPAVASARGSAAPEINPDIERQKAADAFKKALPRQDALPGQIDNLLQSIKEKDDEQLRKLCCQVLLDHARTNKKFNKLLKNHKQWVMKLLNLCSELGVE
jgi:CRISPR-associated protein Cmr6